MFNGKEKKVSKKRKMAKKENKNIANKVSKNDSPQTK
jgi:hypothetical protein